MRLTSLSTDYSEKQKTETKTRSSSGSSEGFSTLLDKMSENKTAEKAQPKRERQKAKRNEELPRANEKDNDEDRVKSKKSAEDDIDPDKKVNRKEEKKTEDADDRVKTKHRDISPKSTAKAVDDETNKQMAEKIAKTLNISEEQVNDILTDLNLAPADLVDQNNVNKFLQKLFEVDSSIELLQVPNIKEMIGQLTKIAENTGADLTQDLTQKNQTSASTLVIADDKKGDTKNNADPSANDDLFPSNPNENGQNTNQNSNTSANAAVTAANASNNGNTTRFTNANQPVDVHNSVTGLDTNYGSSNQTNQTSSTQFTETLAKTRNSSTVNTQEVIQQIVDKIKVDTRGTVTEIKMTLRPDHLGDVTMKITSDNGRIIAQFVAENQRIKEVIESNFNELKEALQQQGIEISELQVSVGQDENEQMQQQFLDQQNKSAQRLRQIIQGLSEEEELEELESPNVIDSLSSNVDYMA